MFECWRLEITYFQFNAMIVRVSEPRNCQLSNLTLHLRSMGNLSNSSSDQSRGADTAGGGGGGGQYSPIHRELGAILKAGSSQC